MRLFDWKKLFSARSGLWLGTIIVIGLLGASNASHNAITTAEATTTTVGTYEPTERERRVSKLISAVLEHQHYRQSPINDPVSSITLDRYIETLDGSRSYFLASDIQEFERIRYQLDDAVISGALDPVFQVYNRFQQRNRERLNYALTLLKTQPDFTIKESFEFDRSKAAWLTTNDEMNELWRKRVKSDALSLMLTGKDWKDTSDTLTKRYERALKTLDKITSDDVFELFINSLVHVFDPHSNYLSPRNSDEFKIQMSLSYEGIGASLQMIDDYVTVQNTIPGGAAAASGLINPNDRIMGVAEGKDGKVADVVGWRLDDVVQLIRGKEGTVVRLEILPASATPGSPEKEVVLKRSKITLEAQAAKKSIHTIKRDGKEIKVGVITVPSFYQDYEANQRHDPNYRSTTRDVRNLINELKTEGVEALVIDLRSNGGGNLQEAVGMTGLFIPNGPVVQVRETGGDIQVLNDDDTKQVWDGPLTVLTDRLSASASEIFSGAIQDYGRGLVIGQQTYGKGTVQNLYPLDRFNANKTPSFGELTITIGKFYRVTGESTQHRGVQPDIALPSVISTEDVGESTQQSALPWARIRTANFSHSNNLKPSIDTLVQEHNQRV
ncbi:MAG: carboxy terminal-processing peptidase, partial [Steroidobacter sp.]